VFQKIPGFQPIPFDKIGLFKDEYRRTLPTDGEIGRNRAGGAPKNPADKNFGT